MLIKPLKSETKIEAFLFKREGLFYRVSRGQRALRSFETFIHPCTKTGRVDNWSNELFTSRKTNPEEVFDDYIATTN